MNLPEARKYLTKDPHYISTAINQVAAEAFLDALRQVEETGILHNFKKLLEMVRHQHTGFCEFCESVNQMEKLYETNYETN